MKFRISTALLFIALLSVSLGWYIDRHDEEIVGYWHSSTDSVVAGYQSTLVIRKDGTFEKRQDFNGKKTVFSGSYHVEENGLFAFRVSETTYSSLGKEPTVNRFSDSFQCRCAIDKSGHLLVQVTPNAGFSENKLNWESYVRSDGQ